MFEPFYRFKKSPNCSEENCWTKRTLISEASSSGGLIAFVQICPQMMQWFCSMQLRKLGWSPPRMKVATKNSTDFFVGITQFTWEGIILISSSNLQKNRTTTILGTNIAKHIASFEAILKIYVSFSKGKTYGRTVPWNQSLWNWRIYVDPNKSPTSRSSGGGW